MKGDKRLLRLKLNPSSKEDFSPFSSSVVLNSRPESVMTNATMWSGGGVAGGTQYESTNVVIKLNVCCCSFLYIWSFLKPESAVLLYLTAILLEAAVKCQRPLQE